MKCTNRNHIMQLLCILCIAAVFITGCQNTTTEISTPYSSYDYKNDLYHEISSETENITYFASDLCVTDTINFGTSETDSQVAKSAGAFNLTTGEVLYSQNLFEKRYPASTTKILTAYIILKYASMDDIVTVSATAADQAEDSSTCGLVAGDTISVQDLLYGLILESGNDAAEALAEYYSGSLEAFGVLMTEEAYKLGATNSNFTNPSGLPDDNHYTTVYDMYLIMNEALKVPEFVELISTKHKAITYHSAKGTVREVTYYNNNRYLTGSEEAPEGFTVIGGKTGTTYDAGYCLALYSKNSAGEDIISIVFKADGRHNLYLLTRQILSKFAEPK